MYRVFVLWKPEMVDAQFNRRMRKTACPVVWKGHGVQSPVPPSDQKTIRLVDSCPWKNDFHVDRVPPFVNGSNGIRSSQRIRVVPESHAPGPERLPFHALCL